MNMKCAICGSDKFHVDVDRLILSCTNCSFYCDFKALVPGSTNPQPQVSHRSAFNPADFEIVNGTLKKYKGTAVNVTVPDGVSSIGREAFSNCSYFVESITLPRSVMHISERAFAACTKLKRIDLPDGLQSIGIEAFAGCSSLASIRIPASVVRMEANYRDVGIGSNTRYESYYTIFSNCTSLADVIYNEDKLSFTVFAGSPFYTKKNTEWQQKKGWHSKTVYVPAVILSLVFLNVVIHVN